MPNIAFPRPDGSHALGDPVEVRRRAQLRHLDHVRGLAEWVDGVRRRIPQGRLRDIDGQSTVPDFDPEDGGVGARVLRLLEAPGRKAIATGFMSRGNPDQTARSFRHLLSASGLDRKQTILWNVILWYLGDGLRIAPPDESDIAGAGSHLLTLRGNLPLLRSVVLIGLNAQRAWDRLPIDPSIRMFRTWHPSPKGLAAYPERRAEITQALIASNSRSI